MNAAKVNVTSVIDNSRLGAFQWGIFLLCGLCLIMDGFDLQSIGSLLFMLQYPVYALTVARIRGSNWKALALLILIALHFAAVPLALRVYRHS